MCKSSNGHCPLLAMYLLIVKQNIKHFNLCFLHLGSIHKLREQSGRGGSLKNVHITLKLSFSKMVHKGEGGCKKGQNFVHEVGECPLTVKNKGLSV